MEQIRSLIHPEVKEMGHLGGRSVFLHRILRHSAFDEVFWVCVCFCFCFLPGSCLGFSFPDPKSRLVSHSLLGKPFDWISDAIEYHQAGLLDLEVE